MPAAPEASTAGKVVLPHEYMTRPAGIIDARRVICLAWRCLPAAPPPPQPHTHFANPQPFNPWHLILLPRECMLLTQVRMSPAGNWAIWINERTASSGS